MNTILASYHSANQGVGRYPAGAAHFGEVGLFGSDSIRNIRIGQVSADALRIMWEINSALGRLGVWVSIYVDGTHHSSTMGKFITIGALSVGTHRIDVVLETNLYKGQWPGFVNLSTGTRPYIAWGATVSLQDVAQYKLHWNAGSGDVSFSSVWQTIDSIEATHKARALPDSGTGNARLTSEGSYSGSSIYVKYHVEIDNAGAVDSTGGGATFKHRRQYLDPATQVLTWSAWEEEIPISNEEQSFSLGDGITCRFSASGPAFDVGDYWEFTIACRQFYNHPANLDDGDYKVTVRSVDKAGNETANTDFQAQFTVDAAPGPPTGVAVSYNAGTPGKVTITGTAPVAADLRSVIIVSNGGRSSGSGRGGAVPEHQFPHDHWATVLSLPGTHPSAELTPASGAGFSYTTGPLVAGFWAFQAIAVDTGGLVSESAIVEIHLVGSPPVEVVFPRAPTGLEAIPQTNGDIRLRYSLFGVAGDTYRAVTVNIYHDDAGGTVDYGTVVTSATNPLTAQWSQLETTITGLVDGNTYIFAVRAVGSTGDEETNTVSVSCKADATAPNVPDLVTVALGV